MTVPGQTPAVADDDREAAERQFTEIYAEHYARLCRFLRYRVSFRHIDRVEDLAQETFILLWKDYVLTGKLNDPENPFPLLATIGKGRVAKFYRLFSNGEFALDMGDPVNTPIFPVKHCYAVDSPHIAGLLRELDAAMDHMSQASKAWRDKHGESYTLRSRLFDTFHAGKGGLTPERRQQISADADAADAEETHLLDVFRTTCERVGALRAELEADAGPAWRSSLEMPVPRHARQGLHDGSLNDPSVTHCPAGHALTLANVHFGEEGQRRCRPCRLEQQRDAKAKNPRMGTARATLSLDALDEAREVLSDPAQDHRELDEIVSAMGLSTTTLRRRIPEVLTDRRKRRDQLPAYVKNPKLGAARALLLDEQCDLTLEQVAAAVDIGVSSIFKQLPGELAERAKRQKPDHSEAAAKIRAMLLNPDNTMSIADMCAAVGWSPTAAYRRVPDAVEARRAMLASRESAGAAR